jgi:hypothetical protein
MLGISILFKLFQTFGCSQWLMQFLTGIVNEKLMSNIASIIQSLAQNSDVNSSLETIKNNPTMQAALQQELRKLKIEYQKEMLKDIRNARARDLELHRLKKHNRRADIMIGIAFIGTIAPIICIIFFRKELSVEVVSLITGLSGGFGVCLQKAFAFEFGSFFSECHHRRDDWL